MFTPILAQQSLVIQWKQVVMDGLIALWIKIAQFLPNLLGMFVILLVGYGISRLLERLSTAILRSMKLDVASEKVGVRDILAKTGTDRTASQIVGRVVFWLFMLTFMISAVETLGLDNVSRTIDSFVAYLPKVIAAALVVIVGLIGAGFVSNLIRAAAEGVGVEYAKALARLVYGVLVVIVATIGIGQLGIEAGLLNRVIEIILLTGGVAIAIAVGFGSRDVAKDIVSGVYARDQYRPGATIQMGDVQGVVESVCTVSTRVELAEGGYVNIPNGRLLDSIVRERADRSE